MRTTDHDVISWALSDCTCTVCGAPIIGETIYNGEWYALPCGHRAARYIDDRLTDADIALCLLMLE